VHQRDEETTAFVRGDHPGRVPGSGMAAPRRRSACR
jgi:hypothetical protein